ncbi:FIG00554670: hypothetical protein [Cronobacter sakazakii 696]|nr:FIG00554670: hypothetical protein [Cronobacter sakazakii 696]
MGSNIFYQSVFRYRAAMLALFAILLIVVAPLISVSLQKDPMSAMPGMHHEMPMVDMGDMAARIRTCTTRGLPLNRCPCRSIMPKRAATAFCWRTCQACCWRSRSSSPLFCNACGCRFLARWPGTGAFTRVSGPIPARRRACLLFPAKNPCALAQR